MAKQRMVNTKFWVDAYVSNLDPSEKLLFLYFLTNPYTDICGIYEVPIKHVALETGLDKDMVMKIIDRFSRDGKIFYEEGWVAVKNFAKHQLKNPKVEKGIEIGLTKAPKSLIDRLSIEYETLSHSNSNLNSNSNPNTAPSAGTLGNELINLFEGLNPSYKLLFKRKPQHEAAERLVSTYGLEHLSKVLKFVAAHRADRFCPTITTPAQLEEKWGALESYAMRLKTSTASKGRGIEL